MKEPVSAVVEADLDAAVVKRLFADAGIPAGPIHVKSGREGIRAKIVDYNRAAAFVPFFVLVDLDRDYRCAPDLIREWLPNPEPRLRLRVAVRAVEAWLMGDRLRAASWLRVGQKRIPDEPESLKDPKRKLIEIVDDHSKGDVKADIVPRPGSGRTVGPAYSSRLIDYVNSTKGWRPSVAAQSCDSLARTRKSLIGLAAFLKLVD